MSKWIFIFAFIGTGCAISTYSTAIRAPNGEDWIGVDCAGHSQVACYAEAGYQCPGGYDIQQEDGHFSTQFNSNAIAVGNTASSSANTHEVHSGSMVIKCHGKSKAQIDAEAERVAQIQSASCLRSILGCPNKSQDNP